MGPTLPLTMASTCCLNLHWRLSHRRLTIHIVLLLWKVGWLVAYSAFFLTSTSCALIFKFCSERRLYTAMTLLQHLAKLFHVLFFRHLELLQNPFTDALWGCATNSRQARTLSPGSPDLSMHIPMLLCLGRLR